MYNKCSVAKIPAKMIVYCVSNLSFNTAKILWYYQISNQYIDHIIISSHSNGIELIYEISFVFLQKNWEQFILSCKLSTKMKITFFNALWAEDVFKVKLHLTVVF